MNKSKINKYKINNNNKTNTKHEFNVKYERYKQDISKDIKLCLGGGGGGGGGGEM